MHETGFGSHSLDLHRKPGEQVIVCETYWEWYVVLMHVDLVHDNLCPIFRKRCMAKN